MQVVVGFATLLGAGFYVRKGVLFFEAVIAVSFRLQTCWLVVNRRRLRYFLHRAWAGFSLFKPHSLLHLLLLYFFSTSFSALVLHWILIPATHSLLSFSCSFCPHYSPLRFFVTCS